jgi:hypothetical protein
MTSFINLDSVFSFPFCSEPHTFQLVRHLFSRKDLTDDVGFLSQINEIKFIMPFVVQGNFHTIYPQFNSNKFVPFIGSVCEENYVALILWIVILICHLDHSSLFHAQIEWISLDIHCVPYQL